MARLAKPESSAVATVNLHRPNCPHLSVEGPLGCIKKIGREELQTAECAGWLRLTFDVETSISKTTVNNSRGNNGHHIKLLGVVLRSMKSKGGKTFTWTDELVQHFKV